MSLESPDARTLYYTKTGGDGPLFARLLDGGGEEKQVLGGARSVDSSCSRTASSISILGDR